MPVVGKLSARKVATAKPGMKLGDGGGLWLATTATGAKFWSFRFKMRGGKPREMGLGSAADVSLAEAREAARECRRLLGAGIDPMEHRNAEKAEQRGMTFEAVAKLYLEAHADSWRNEKHRRQWASTLEQYAFPTIGALGVNQVCVGDVLAILEPIWREKAETARRLHGRLEAVLDYASARRWRAADNPARWSGHLENLLPDRSKVRAVQHHPALPWRDLPAFWGALRKQSGTGARALGFAILTAARSGEVIGATWQEIDLGARLWTIPGERMKSARTHRIPLSDPAMAILAEMARDRRTNADPVFQSSRGRRPLSSSAMSAVLRRMGRGDVTVHGFRSTFSDWTAETTTYDHATRELCLAHSVGNAVERAYQRGELIEKRRRLLADWATYTEGRSAPASEVVPIRGAG